MASRRRAPRPRILALGGTALAAGAGFAAVAVATARRDTAHADRRVRRKAKAPGGHPARRAAHLVALSGKWHVYLPLAVALAAIVAARGGRRPRSRRAGAAAIVAASAIAAALGPVFDRVLPQPPPPPGHRSRRKPVFPSGHALGATALGLTGAYVLVREEMAPAAAVVPAALAYAVLASGGKLVEDKHWLSDLVGGTLAGGAVGGSMLAAYERYR